MGLVDYASSSEDDNDDNDHQHTAKKRKLSSEKNNTVQLPPLPSNFRDLYSSTVRSSTQDDPSLHGGRKRVTPHVVGNWPAHVFLEWSPTQPQQTFLSDLISTLQQKDNLSLSGRQKEKKRNNGIHTLLETDLAVPLPLHISLSRPLTLKTSEKDTFLENLTSAITATTLRSFKVAAGKLTWHPNEDKSRWFLVLSLQRKENVELRRLLEVCNQQAGEVGQPLLYQRSRDDDVEDEKFHVSLAWSLTPQEEEEMETQEGLMEKLKAMDIEFGEVKVRIGQDVMSIPLRKRRGAIPLTT